MRSRLFLLARALGAAALVATFWVTTTATAQSPDKIRLQIKWVPQAQFAGYFVALDKGYYANQSLDVQIIPGGPDIVTEQQVTNGQVEPSSVLRARKVLLPH